MFKQFLRITLLITAISFLASSTYAEISNPNSVDSINGDIYSKIEFIDSDYIENEAEIAANEFSLNDPRRPRPRPKPQPRPRPNRFRIGERAYNIRRDNVLVEVVGYERNGQYVVYFLEGPLRGKTGGNWSFDSLAKTHGCNSQRACIGDLFINNLRDYVQTKVVGIQSDGKLVLHFLEGTLRGKTGSNWQMTSLSWTRGCNRIFCIDDYAINTARNYVRVQIVGIQHQDRKYVLRFMQGPLRGKVGGNWSENSLARVR